MLTVSLHFLAVQLLVGGLLIGSLWAIAGRRTMRQPLLDASGAIATRLPILMTYVINLGVPPLLFAQVLYGRALYTSSILIGVFWIGVILLLMASYTCLYVMSGRAGKGKPWGWIGLVALLITIKIGMIYTSNMTLMLRPEVWRDMMYRADALGLHLNSGDPTVLPRWLFMMLSGLTVGGVGLMLLGLTTWLADESAEFVRCWGARLAVLGVLLQAGLGFWVYRVISEWPEATGSAAARTFYVVCLIVWCACALLVMLVCLVAQARARSRSWLWPGAAGLLVFVQTLAMAIYRGGIRDAALATKGLDVWDRQIAANWVVVGAFLILFVFGLAMAGWLTSVVFRAQGVEEKYA
jgi:hypothetical protein